MNKRVLQTAIILIVCMLVFQYILKIFFPQEFVLVISNPNIIKFGEYVDNHLWASILTGIITSFITYWFYLCATIRKWKLNLKEVFIVLIIIISSIFIDRFLTDFSLMFGILSMLILPLVFKANKLKDVVIPFSIHFIVQYLSLNIRSIGILIPSSNFAMLLILTLDMYFVLILLYLLFNFHNIKKSKGE